ncbi:tRNA lysidine(34) synthetase TilS [Thorsellia kenyensis]|uniref:tRNA(Ile)-lysidine synthase n=1 Tax=Thorsellia kenyensis TaxID=1549888 RepID=A0ABV6C6X3_9GAMM
MSNEFFTHPFYSHLLDCFQKYLSNHSAEQKGQNFEITILLGLSGGLDSVVLLDLLHHFKALQTKDRPQKEAISFPLIKQITALYVHHGLSQNADDWADHSRRLCAELDVKFIVEKVTVNPKNSGIEAAARDARYAAFKKHLGNNTLLLTAQHLDDQAETFLLALKRGSGIRGLSSMAPCQQLDTGQWQLRPLLNITRRELENYALDRKLTWIEDESNEDTRFDRNFLRLKILPQLDERWPGFNQSVAMSAQLCHQEAKLLDELLSPILYSVSSLADKTLLISPLKEWSFEKRQAIIKKWCEQYTLQPISREQLRRIWDEVVLSREDSTALVELGLAKDKLTRLEIRRYKDKLYLVEAFHLLTEQALSHWEEDELVLSKDHPNIILPWQQEPISFNEIVCFIRLNSESCPNASLSLIKYLNVLETKVLRVKFNLANTTKIKLPNKIHRQTLKQLWHYYGVPPWQRRLVPMIFENDRLLCALGVFVADLS